MESTHPGRRPRRALTALTCFLAAGAVTVAGTLTASTFASADAGPVVVTPDVDWPTQPTVPAPTTTTTTGPADPVDPALRPGAEGPAVTALQEQLTDLGYWLGKADGRYGATTEQAVLAFQKAEGLPRDGVASPAVLDRLADAGRAPGRSQAGSGAVVEVDLTRQLLLIRQDGETVWALNTSTGARSTPTPPGAYQVTRQVDGVRHAPLGVLYRPKYFFEGYAVHGSPDIPGYAASHGCARVSNAAMDMLWQDDLLPKGTPVWVYA